MHSADRCLTATVKLELATTPARCTAVLWRHLVHTGGTAVRHAFERLELSVGTAAWMAIGRDFDSLPKRSTMPKNCSRQLPSAPARSMIAARAAAMAELSSCVHGRSGERGLRSGWSLEYHIDRIEQATVEFARQAAAVDSMLALGPAVITAVRMVVVREPLALLQSLYTAPEGFLRANTYDRSKWAPGLAARNASAFVLGQGGAVQWSALMGRPSRWNANTYRPSTSSRLHEEDSDTTMRSELARFNVVGTTERLAEVMLCVCHVIGLVTCPVLRRESTHAPPRWPSTLDAAELNRLVGSADRRLHAIAGQRIDDSLRAVAPEGRRRYLTAVIRANNNNNAKPPRSSPSASPPCPLPYRWTSSDEDRVMRNQSILHPCVSVSREE